MVDLSKNLYKDANIQCGQTSKQHFDSVIETW